MVLGDGYNGSVLLTQEDGTLRRVDTAHLRNTIDSNRAHADSAHTRIDATNANVQHHWDHFSWWDGHLQGQVDTLSSSLTSLTNKVDDPNTNGVCVPTEGYAAFHWNNALKLVGGVINCSKAQTKDKCHGNCGWIPR